VSESVEKHARKRPRIAINERWCKGCGICIEMCPAKVFTAAPVTGKAHAASPEKCTGCGNCELYCPDYAISLIRDEGIEGSQP
jgi:2-oxoglutarate ferredoxin oxidoreductase subunit delta